MIKVYHTTNDGRIDEARGEEDDITVLVPSHRL